MMKKTDLIPTSPSTQAQFGFETYVRTDTDRMTVITAVSSTALVWTMVASADVWDIVILPTGEHVDITNTDFDDLPDGVASFVVFIQEELI